MLRETSANRYLLLANITSRTAFISSYLSLRVERSNLYNYLVVKKQFYVYILTNFTNNVLYTGITNNLIRRIYEHKSEFVSSFASKYKANKLVYFEIYENSYDAIAREKQIKAGSRKKKLELIELNNKEWKDLYDEII